MKSQEEHLRCAEAAKIDVVEALRVNYRGSSHLTNLELSSSCHAIVLVPSRGNTFLNSFLKMIKS